MEVRLQLCWKFAIQSPYVPVLPKSTYAANAGFCDPSENILLPPKFTTGCVGAENRTGDACAKKSALVERYF